MKDLLYKTLSKYSLDLYRGDKPIDSYLITHFSEFVKDINKALIDENGLLEKEDIEIVKRSIIDLQEICNSIINVIKTTKAGKVRDANEKVFQLFDRLSNNLGSVDIYK